MKDYSLLYQKFIDQKCSPDEAEMLLDYFLSKEGDAEMVGLIESYLEKQPSSDWTVQDEKAIENNHLRIMQAIKPRKSAIHHFRWYAAAAAIVLVTVGTWLYTNTKSSQDNPIVAQLSSPEPAPGKIAATLTLSNGKKIRLSEASNGLLAKEAGIKISKTANGQLVYDLQPSSTDEDHEGSVKSNTLSTSNGETYQLHLPDGSKVWLNAASSLTFNASLYQQGKRTVKLEGEAYFEISRDKAHPFIVQTEMQDIKVLGTHFNVMAYNDESAAKTTLVEGSVEVNSTLIQPGQQAQTYQNITKITNVNTNDIVAWKNNLFVFRNENIQSIMKKIGRWYNVDIEFRNKSMLNKNFGGTFSRFENVSDMLHTMELTGEIQFKIEGRRIIVM